MAAGMVHADFALIVDVFTPGGVGTSPAHDAGVRLRRDAARYRFALKRPGPPTEPRAFRARDLRRCQARKSGGDGR